MRSRTPGPWLPAKEHRSAERHASPDRVSCRFVGDFGFRHSGACSPLHGQLARQRWFAECSPGRPAPRSAQLRSAVRRAAITAAEPRQVFLAQPASASSRGCRSLRSASARTRVSSLPATRVSWTSKQPAVRAAPPTARRAWRQGMLIMLRRSVHHRRWRSRKSSVARLKVSGSSCSPACDRCSKTTRSHPRILLVIRSANRGEQTRS